MKSTINKILISMVLCAFTLSCLALPVAAAPAGQNLGQNVIGNPGQNLVGQNQGQNTVGSQGQKNVIGSQGQNSAGQNQGQNPVGSQGQKNVIGSQGQNSAGQNQGQNPVGSQGQKNVIGSQGQNPVGSQGQKNVIGSQGQNPVGSQGQKNIIGSQGQNQAGQNQAGQNQAGQNQAGQNQEQNLAGNQGQTGNQGQNSGDNQGQGNVSAQDGNASVNQADTRREAFAEKYERMQAVYQEKIKTHEAARKHFLELGKQYADSERQEEKHEEIKLLMIEQVRRYLENAVETMLQRVESLKERVSNMPGISSANKEKLIADLNKDMAWLKDKLAEAKNTSELEELKKIAEAIRGYWKDHDLRVKQITGYVLLGNADKVIEKAENMAKIVEQRIQVLEKNGLDAALAENYLAEYKELLWLAKQKQAEVETMFGSIGSDVVSGVDAFHEGMQIMQDFKKLLLDVRDRMKDALQEIKNLGVKFDAASLAPKEKDVDIDDKNE
ncbi:hypothetical protein HZB94_00025 [Candidatus Falkowbacteria bacterium]|nr:hypothetical protein [Candidatus Falkowbacteria bacterium]